MKTTDWLARDAKALASVLPRCSDVVGASGSGSWITDTDGNRYLDFASGIAANSTGHCHPKVVEAICEQAKTLINTSVVTHQTRNIELAERLGALCPFFEEPQVFFSNSGAEAVDGSLKLARRVTGRSGVVAFTGGFHGRTVAATSLTTAKRKYREGYTPLLPYVYHAVYNGNIDDLRAQIIKAPYKIGAMIVEPVLGEGGYIVADVSWLQRLKTLCYEYDIALIFDEVQTGIGRTGFPFAAETFGVTPDVILFSKGIASGLPLGGIIANKELMDKWPTGTHGSTFGGNPVSCAAALATLDVLSPLYQRVHEKGKELLSRLARWNARGVGYMVGIPLKSKEHAEQARKLCQEEGLIILSCGPDENVLRLIPPLTINDEDLNLGLSILEWALIVTEEC